jgi:hypothetical protein
LRPVFLPAALLGLAFVLQTTGISFPLFGAGRVVPESDTMPVELLPELQEFARSNPPGTPIFNEMTFGGFLIYYAPQLRVFIDDRCELYGDEGLLAYALALTERPEQIEEWQRQYGFVLALTVRGSNFDRFLRGAVDWEVIRETESATLFRRRDLTSGHRPKE